jgi:hypothetical protein
MAYTFDGTNKVISFDVSTESFDVRDLWSRWVDWLLTSDNSKYPLAIRNVGGDPLPGSKELGLTYFLLNDWKIKPYEESHTLTVNGNLYSEDGSSPYAMVSGSYQVMIINSVSNLVDSTVQQLPEIEYSSFQNQVTIDVDNGAAGTAYPIGTYDSPVNNLADAITIANARGFKTFFLLSDLTITTGQDVADYHIKSDTWKVVTVESGAETTNTEYTKISLYGEMCGTWNTLNDCWIYTITNFLGWVRGGSWETIELAPYIDPDPLTRGSSYFDNIVPMYANTPCILVMNINTSVTITHSSEIHKIHNMETNSIVTIGLIHGRVIVDSTCTGGEIHVMGIGTYENNSVLTINDNSLVNPEIINAEAAAALADYDGPTNTELNTAVKNIKGLMIGLS